MENKSLNLRLTTKMLTFQLSFASEVNFTDLVLLSLEKYLSIKMYMTFQSITILLTNLIYYTFRSI